MIEKTDVIGGLDLPEKAEHTRERKSIAQICRASIRLCVHHTAVLSQNE